MTTTKRWVVVLEASSCPCGTCFVGELDRGLRQGVLQLRNAIRFTRVGAARVAREYPGATARHEDDFRAAAAVAS